jgi:hypothetical protein
VLPFGLTPRNSIGAGSKVVLRSRQPPLDRDRQNRAALGKADNESKQELVLLRAVETIFKYLPP